MDLTSPEKRRVQKLRAGRRSPPPRRAIEDDDEEITRPDPPRPPAVRALSTGLNFKAAVRTVQTTQHLQKQYLIREGKHAKPPAAMKFSVNSSMKMILQTRLPI